MNIGRVLGVGNALTDIVINLESDAVLEQHSLARGGMTLLSSEQQSTLESSLGECEKSLSLGGSAGNTMRAMSYLYPTVGYMGKVGCDSTGDYFAQALIDRGIEPHIYRGSDASGRCLSLISADGERTMATYLGAALSLEADEIDDAIFEGYNTLYVEGYLVQNHSLIESLVRRAKQAGLSVAIDLASYNVVEENLEFLRTLVADYIDIVFANEDEAHAFTGYLEPMDALYSMSQLCEGVVVKIGSKGALVKYGEQIVHSGVVAEAKRVDTTGAGDYFAAGFLSALGDSLPLEACATAGAVTAGAIIEVMGTTLSEGRWREIEALYQKIKQGDYLL